MAGSLLKVEYTFKLTLLLSLGLTATLFVYFLLAPTCLICTEHRLPANLLLPARELDQMIDNRAGSVKQGTFRERTRTMHGTRKFGYVLGIHFNGQQSAGIRSLTSLQCWVGSFNLPMYVVEPLIVESVVHTVANESQTNGLRLRDFFDIHRYNERTKNLGYRELASWEDFMLNAPRNVVIVRTKRGCTGTKRASPKVLWEADDTQKCKKLDKSLRYLPLFKEFCVKKIVKFYVLCAADVIFTGEEMYRYIFDRWNPGELTVAIDYWTGAWHVPPSLDAPSVCKDSHESGLRGRLYPSERLLWDSQRYESMFIADGSRFSVAAMIRSEQLLNNLEPDSIRKDFSYCLHEVLKLIDQDHFNSIRDEPFITIDVGRFGSSSLIAPYRLLVGGKKTVVRKMRKLTTAVFGRNLTFDRWEDSFIAAAGGITDSGYIAALQRTIASRADCLVLVGGGQFLKIALHQYLDLHPDQRQWCTRFICVEGRFREEYDEILAQQVS